MIALYGQVVGALVMAVLGFVPGYMVSLALGLDQATILVIGAWGQNPGPFGSPRTKRNKVSHQ